MNLNEYLKAIQAFAADMELAIEENEPRVILSLEEEEILADAKMLSELAYYLRNGKLRLIKVE